MARYLPHPGFTEKLHKLDKERDIYMKNSEKKCRKRRMGGVDFYTEVILWKNRRDVWNSLTIRKKGAWINCEIIKPREKLCVIQRPLSITLTEAGRAYKICSDDLDRLKPYADVYRARFLARRVKEEVASGNIKKSNKLRVSWIERY